MRRDDLAGPVEEGPATLEEALRAPDWDDLVRPEAPPGVEAPEPAPQPEGDGRRERRRQKRDARARHKDDRARKRSDRLALRRHRILPRTVIAIASMLLFFGLGGGV